jgi:hypothetical protein
MEMERYYPEMKDEILQIKSNPERWTKYMINNFLQKLGGSVKSQP